MYLQLIYTNPQTAGLSCNPLIKQPGWSLPLPRLISLSRLKRIGTNKEHKQGSDSQLFKGLGDSSGDQLLSAPLAGTAPQPTSLLTGTCKNSSVFSRSPDSPCGTGILWEDEKKHSREGGTSKQWDEWLSDCRTDQQEQPYSSREGQEEKKMQGITVGGWLPATIWNKSLPLLVVCGGHCFCVVFPNISLQDFSLFLRFQLKMPWLHMDESD